MKGNNSVSRDIRLLDLYVRMRQGHIIHKDEESLRFHVNERTIQRDLDSIRSYLEEAMLQGRGCESLLYDRQRKGYVLHSDNPSAMSNSEIFAVAEILLESRAFTKGEMSAILDKLLQGCVPVQKRKTVAQLIGNEAFHYVEPRHGTLLTERLWDLGNAVQQSFLLELEYTKMSGESTPRRIVEPVAVLFSEYYFYLVAYNMVRNGSGTLRTEYEYPAYYRVDRIRSYRQLEERFVIPYIRRFETGELRKRVQFMYGGRLLQVKFRYTGPSVEAVLDRLPTAKIRENHNGSYLIEAEVFGIGIVRWLLSQGDSVEVLAPAELREEMTRQTQQLVDRYLK